MILFYAAGKTCSLFCGVYFPSSQIFRSSNSKEDESDTNLHGCDLR
jgi:hypothetical protein